VPDDSQLLSLVLNLSSSILVRQKHAVCSHPMVAIIHHLKSDIPLQLPCNIHFISRYHATHLSVHHTSSPCTVLTPAFGFTLNLVFLGMHTLSFRPCCPFSFLLPVYGPLLKSALYHSPGWLNLSNCLWLNEMILTADFSISICATFLRDNVNCCGLTCYNKRIGTDPQLPQSRRMLR